MLTGTPLARASTAAAATAAATAAAAADDDDVAMLKNPTAANPSAVRTGESAPVQHLAARGTAQQRGDVLLNQALPADAMAPLLLVDTNCPFRASVARQFESELTTSFPLPLSQYPRNAVVYSHKEASSGRLIVQLRYLPSVPGPHFGGTDEPAAFCELLLSPKQLRSITYNMRMQLRLYLSHALERYFAIRPDRYYLRFMDRDQTSQQDQMLLGKASISGTELMSQESIAFLDGGSRGGGGGGGGRREYPPSQIALPRDNEPVERRHRQDGLGLPGAW